MVNEATRHIKKEVERDLWARAAGRCQFEGCNRILYRSPVTQEAVNIAEKAHIYSFSKKGPRGWGPFSKNTKELNNISNLMLVCHDCHKKIDQDKSGCRYFAELLIDWKLRHEQRIELVTGICPDKKSFMILYGAKIGDEKSPLQFNAAAEAMFPEWYPAEERAVNLSMACEHEDRTEAYWKTEAAHLKAAFQKNIVPRITDNLPLHFSIFALAPQPLLILLGTLLTDKISTEVYQLHREPKTWKWQPGPGNFEFIINEPGSFEHPPALLISLSDKIDPTRARRVTGGNCCIWELTVENYHNDFLRDRSQLAEFRKIVRRLMVSIKEKHGQETPLSIFPAMPVACAVELGRIRMPKADMPWTIYDQSNKEQQFIQAIQITGD